MRSDPFDRKPHMMAENIGHTLCYLSLWLCGYAY